VGALLAGERRGNAAQGRRLGAVGLQMAALLGCVGAYAIAKGELSEKPAVRMGIGLPATVEASWTPPGDAPRGLDGLPPKEEGEGVEVDGVPAAAAEAALRWARLMGIGLAPLALVGAWLAPPGAGRRVLRLYVLLFSALVVRHAAVRGYLSSRHLMPLVVATLPWAAWRLARLGDRLAGWLRIEGRGRRVAALGALGLMLAAGLVTQAKPVHPTRWGHWAAGVWLRDTAAPGAAVLDTRGWAGFVSGLRVYDAWHVRQALTDGGLAYVVVEADELTAASERAGRLRAWLDANARPIRTFPRAEGATGVGVLVYAVDRAAAREDAT
jgi:hypothetical protein